MRSIWPLLLLLASYSAGTSALRCYTCEDCDEHSQPSELVVCSVPASVAAGQPAATSPSLAAGSPAPATAVNGVATGTPAAAAPAAATPAAATPAAAAESGDEEDYDSDEEEETPPASTMGIMPASAAAAGRPTGPVKPPAPAIPATNSESEDEEEEEDYDDRRRRKRSVVRQAQAPVPVAVQSPVQGSFQRPVCYIASLRLNGTDITNRGCTLVSEADQSSACNGLFNGWEVVGCQLCEGNGCNAPMNAVVLGQLTGGSASGQPTGWTGLGMTLLAIVSTLWICN